MKNLFKEAHKLTKEIKEQYPEVDYKAQFGICLSYLRSNKEEGNMKLYLMEVDDGDTNTYEYSNRGSIAKGWNFVGNAEQVLAIADKVEEMGLIKMAHPWINEELVLSINVAVSNGYDKQEVIKVLKRVR